MLYHLILFSKVSQILEYYTVTFQFIYYVGKNATDKKGDLIDDFFNEKIAEANLIWNWQDSWNARKYILFFFFAAL